MAHFSGSDFSGSDFSGTTLKQRYHVLEPMGDGGSGITYRAQDLQTHEMVVIKTLSLRQAGEWKAIELFEREAQILRQIDHPQIPRYLDYFVVDAADNRTFCLVQQMAEGKSLYRWMQEEGRCTEADVKAIALQLLPILDYLHQQVPAIVHRDLKPHNIVRRSDGQLFLVDFGAVKSAYYTTMMRGSTVVGTYGYMAPEQFRGLAVPATDLYGLGATLLFLLTQRSPTGLPMQRLKIDFRSQIQISEPFADWLEQMLEPGVKDRFGSAQEARLALESGGRSVRGRFKPELINFVTPLVILGTLLLAGGGFHFFYHYNAASQTKASYEEILSGRLDVKTYLSMGNNVNARDHNQRTLIFYAILSHQVRQVRQAVQGGANLAMTDNLGRTPLHVSAANCSPDVFAYLLSLKPIDLSTKDNSGKTIVDSVTSDPCGETLIDHVLSTSMPSGEKDKILSRVANMATKKLWLRSAIRLRGKATLLQDMTYEDIAIEAVKRKESQVLRVLVAQKQKLSANFFSQVSFGDLQGLLPLKEILLLLPKINAQDNRGFTLLHYVAAQMRSRQDISLMRRLIQQGADVNQSNQVGGTPLISFFMFPGGGLTQLDQLEIISILLDADANLNYAPQLTYGETVLHLAARESRVDQVQILLRKGANPDARNNRGNTPLHLAVSNPDIFVIRALIAANGNVNAINSEGYTPLDMASNPKVKAALREAGGKTNKTSR
jgi:ankyrin repeat protein